MNQRTLKKAYTFEGKGLHSGNPVRMTLRPAAAGEGIAFLRTDKHVRIPAVAEYVARTSRSTSLASGRVSVSTVEHVLSALCGLGVDNALVELSAPEVPILDGSALPYAEAILADGLAEQEVPRKELSIGEAVECRDEKSGSWIRITPAETLSFDITVDFNSRVLGVQKVHWDPSVDYAAQIAPCRTFCFLHEIQWLATLGLVKGGDVKNAIVVVEKPVGPRVTAALARRFGQSGLGVTPAGYLNNLELRFPDERGRHKMLDIIGDMFLVGGYLKARVEGYKPGHAINTKAAALLRQKIRGEVV